MANDTKLNEIERKMEVLRLEIKERERRVNERIDKLIAERQAEKKKKDKDEKSNQVLQPARIVGSIEALVPNLNKPAASTGDMSIRTIDRNLGAFFGTGELRDAIKDAQTKMHTTTGSLQRVREHTHTPFVRKEIERLFKCVRILTQVFNRMMDRMELPDAGEEFFLDDITDK